MSDDRCETCREFIAVACRRRPGLEAGTQLSMDGDVEVLIVRNKIKPVVRVLEISGVLCLFGLLCGMAIAEVKLGKSPVRSTEALAYNCYTCHWIDSAKPANLEPAEGIPTLHGRSAEELLKKLREFRNKQGSPTIMNRIAAGYSDEELARIANFIASAGKQSAVTSP